MDLNYDRNRQFNEGLSEHAETVDKSCNLGYIYKYTGLFDFISLLKINNRAIE